MNMSKKSWVKPTIVGCAVVALAAIIYFVLVFLNIYTVDVTLVGDSEIVVEYGDSFDDPGATAVFYGTIFQQEPLDVPVTVEGSVDLTKLGTYELRYHAEYEETFGENARTVRVVDTVKPEIALLGEETVSLPVGEEYQESGCTASDNYNGDLTESVSITGTLDPAVPGSYVLTYSVSDESGNKAQTTRTVIYVDVTAPVITLTGDAEMELDNGAVYEEPGFSATDDCDGDVTELVAVEGTVDTGTPGTYTLTYTVTDAGGNTATAQRFVTVKDLTPPELTLLGDAVVELTIGNGFEEPGFTATDNSDGDLTEQVQVSGEVNMYLPGTYTLTYTVTDAAGNTTEATRTVVMCEIRAQVSGGVIYLTYDDGPSGYTSGLLDVLDRYGVKATFFVVNTGYGDTMARAANSGHTIAIHSATHNYDRIYASEEAYFDDLYYMQSIIQSYTGQTPMMLRFPGGSSNSVSKFNPGIMTRLTQLVQEKGFRYFDWNVSSEDAGGVTHGWAEVAYNVIRGASYRGTSVVLMHDSNGMCIRATERIIQWGLANGYTFLALTYDGPGCHHGVRN